MSLIKPSESVLLVVDIQEKLAPHIVQSDVVTENTYLLMQMALKLNVPVTVTEHYPQGLGHTVQRLRELLPACDVFPKIHFAATGEAAILQHLKAIGRKNIIVTGSETHVCVMQSALGLLQSGFEVWIVEDASSSRETFDRRTAIKRLNRAGVQSLSTEMLMFEWLQRGDSPEFKESLGVIKNTRIKWRETS